MAGGDPQREQKPAIVVLEYNRPRKEVPRPKLPNPAAERSLRLGLGLLMLVPVAMVGLRAITSENGVIAFAVVMGIHWLALCLGAIIYGYIGCGRAAEPDVGGTTSALLGTLLGIGGLGFVAIYVGAMMATNRTYGPTGELARIKCSASLRMISQACSRYSAENGGQCPSSLTDLCVSGILTPQALICSYSTDTPASGTGQELAAMLGQAGHCSYVYRGAGMTTASAADKVIAYEPLENHDRKGMHVLYGDGRIVWLNRTQAVRFAADLPPGSRAPPGKTAPAAAK